MRKLISILALILCTITIVEAKEIPPMASCDTAFIQSTAERIIASNLVDCPIQKAKKCFRAGGFWNQLWVRDTSYSALMGLGDSYPEELKNTFVELVLRNGKKGYPAQDAAADFGAFPYQTDSIVWVVGAWHFAERSQDEPFQEYVYGVAKKMRPVWDLARDKKDGLLFGAASFLDSWASYPAHWNGQRRQLLKHKFLSTNVLWVRFQEILLRGEERFGKISAEQADIQQKKIDQLIRHLNEKFYDLNSGYYTYYIGADRYEGLGNGLLEQFGYNYYEIMHPVTVENFYPTLSPMYETNDAEDWYARTNQQIWVDAFLSTLHRQDLSLFCSKYNGPLQALNDIQEMILAGDMFGGTAQLWGAVGIDSYLKTTPASGSGTWYTDGENGY